MKKLLPFFLLPLFVLSVSTCANRGLGPQGGPVDSIPPRMVRSTPLNGALNYQKKQVEIGFDEYIQLDNPSENVIFSPPQKQQPLIEARGKRIRITYQDTIQPNTTYTIDFGNGVQDNNESNPMENFSFSFSTGTNMDSLEVYGTLIDAETLTPLKGVIVGLHTCQDDSAFEKLPFTRIGKTNSEGEFTIRNIKEGTYRLYALQDLNRDYIYQPGERIAFYDQPIKPYITVRTEIDTIWRDSVTNDSVYHLPDSIYTAEYFYFEPSDILLQSFEEDMQHTYLERVERTERRNIKFAFVGKQPSMPQLKALNTDSSPSWDWLKETKYSFNPKGDTLTCWLLDTTTIKTDSLCLVLSYHKTDSAYQLQPQTDTLWAVYRMTQAEKTALKKKRKKTEQKQTIQILEIKSNARNTFEVFDTMQLTLPTPVSRIDMNALHFEKQKDTLWVQQPCQYQATDEAQHTWRILTDVQPGATYRLTVDSAAVADVYGLTNNAQTFTWKVKALDQYATLRVHVEENNPLFIVQLLSERDQPVREQRVKNSEVMFRNLAPGTYYMRIVVDSNGDGKWTTGSWKQKRQPEQVFYFRKKMTLRANWDFEETFTFQQVPLLEQKPRSLIEKATNANKKK